MTTFSLTVLCVEVVCVSALPLPNPMPYVSFNCYQKKRTLAKTVFNRRSFGFQARFSSFAKANMRAADSLRVHEVSASPGEM